MTEHLRDKNLSAKFIADEIGLSLGYTRNLFKTIEGVALNEYIGMKRIDEAKDLLSTTKQSINAIRESLGFSNTAYFCTYFKKQTGKSPRNTETSRGRPSNPDYTEDLRPLPSVSVRTCSSIVQTGCI